MDEPGIARYELAEGGFPPMAQPVGKQFSIGFRGFPHLWKSSVRLTRKTDKKIPGIPQGHFQVEKGGIRAILFMMDLTVHPAGAKPPSPA
ncbi:MAG: hypothetical protein EOP85_07795 [Verrucomicrobiaceae bacterium]|nr:MAG: hypothetical protein EOP85_07795 [Verrucomicrobiaceae bacterium]